LGPNVSTPNDQKQEGAFEFEKFHQLWQCERSLQASERKGSHDIGLCSFCGFCGFGLKGLFGFCFLGWLLVVLVYTSSVLRGTLRFIIKLFIYIIKSVRRPQVHKKYTKESTYLGAKRT
jgi:hypothetical protein